MKTLVFASIHFTNEWENNEFHEIVENLRKPNWTPQVATVKPFVNRLCRNLYPRFPSEVRNGVFRNNKSQLSKIIVTHLWHEAEDLISIPWFF